MYVNLVTVFFLCGLWHGAKWSFAVWGLFHGTFLVLERLGLANAIGRLPALVRHAYLLVIVMIGWVFFRADTLTGAIAFLKALAGLSPEAPTPFTIQWYVTPDVAIALLAGMIGSLPIVPALARWVDGAPRPGLGRGFAAASTATLVVLLVASIMHMAARAYNPFIYFRF